jgi:hypothetical protein
LITFSATLNSCPSNNTEKDAITKVGRQMIVIPKAKIKGYSKILRKD